MSPSHFAKHCGWAGSHWLKTFALVLLVLAAGACSSLPDSSHVAPTYSLPAAEDGPLKELAAGFVQQHPQGHSGFSLISRADEAMHARLALIDSATTSLDLQYFIWSDDTAGDLLFERLMQAADRGVRVRVLVDDFGLSASSKGLSIASKHPNLSIHVFNPIPGRDGVIRSMFSWLSSFQELNRRMHNKLMIADKQVAIVGGRNIGDAYFGLSDKYNFVDLDVLVIGQVIPELASAFDEYWNDPIVFPAEAFTDSVDPKTHQKFRTWLRERVNKGAERQSLYPIEVQEWGPWLTQRSKGWLSGKGYFMQDDPVAIDGENLRLVDMLAYMSQPSEHELILASPYLIPVDNFLDALAEKAERGIEVHLITNSLGSNNHTIAHSHYRKYREDILATGARLYEFNHQPDTEVQSLAEPELGTAKFISFHTKTMVADGRRSFVGSLNFDPRALVINTENGLLIDSEPVAVAIRDYLLKMKAPENAWQLQYQQDGKIIWRGADGQVLERQPAQGTGQRVKDSLYRWIPIESQL
ncbi:phospholipase D-like domain-containing protein [Ferrimonas marina]|uniref:Phosphatidylserine/phosphatidylglycerophosphate/cardiolipin synthase n=1 Tax=Ferrimonas marina TaxID=299255 RepID=A0A1M5YBN4_9GAMM|nr:phospholipase D family protein [Ferrimonas marina]SHI09329.1 Phosphatidylserine/phosphatidylglycerophosphate/cardiolipin synthase [Ferrimonas marina]